MSLDQKPKEPDVEEIMANLLETLTVNDYDANRRRCHEALAACAKLGSVEGATNVFQVLRECGIEPDYVSYTMLCGALARGGNTAEIQRIMDWFEASGGQLDAHWYATLVLACLTSTPPNQEVAERAFFGMAKRGLRVKRVKALFKKVVGQERYSELLQTLKEQHIDFEHTQRVTRSRHSARGVNLGPHVQSLTPSLTSTCTARGVVGNGFPDSTSSGFDTCRGGDRMHPNFSPGTSSDGAGMPASSRRGDSPANSSFCSAMDQPVCHSVSYKGPSVNALALSAGTPGMTAPTLSRDSWSASVGDLGLTVNAIFEL